MAFLDTARRLLGIADSGTTELLSPWAATADDHLEAVTWAALYGDVHDIGMTRARAMQLSVVSAGRRRIAATSGRLPLRVTRSGEQLPTPQLLTQPEPGRTRTATLTWTIDALMFHPWAHWLVTARDWNGWPSAVQLVHRAQETMENGRLVAVDGQPVQPLDVIRFDSPTSGLLIDGADTLRRAWLLAQAASKAEANPVPALDLHNTGEDLTPEEVETLLSSWEAARMRRGVGYSSRGLDVRPLGASTENLLISGRRQIDLELCRQVGIPAWAADVPVEGSSLNYTNRQSRNAELLDSAMAPYLDAVSARLSLDDVTPRGHVVHFDTDEFVRPLRAERLAMLGAAVTAGILTEDEARAEEGLPPRTVTDQESTE